MILFKNPALLQQDGVTLSLLIPPSLLYPYHIHQKTYELLSTILLAEFHIHPDSFFHIFSIKLKLFSYFVILILACLLLKSL